MKSPSNMPPACPSTRLTTRQNASRAASKSAPLSKRFEASVLIDRALDPFLIVTGLKYALSMRIFYVSSPTALSNPPIIPAKAIGAFPSVINK